MNKKGFTLIELLAVIVILAIIALIATPIILNIISDSKEESNKRSVELYGKAVEQAIAKSQLNGREISAGDLSADLLSTVQYSGSEVTCTTNKLYEDGSIYLAGCSVGTDTKEYTYGIEQIKTIYRFGEEKIRIGDIVNPIGYTTDASTLNKYAYLKHVLDSDNKVIESYACALFNGKEVCVRGGNPDFFGYAENEGDYTGNLLISRKLESEGISCSYAGCHPEDGWCSYECLDASAGLDADSGGYVSSFSSDTYTIDAQCFISSGSSYCKNY